MADLERVAGGVVVVSAPCPQTHPLRTPEADWPGPDRGLTPRESEALVLLAQGLTNRAIAKAMYVSVDTVKTHLRNVYRKLQLRIAPRPWPSRSPPPASPIEPVTWSVWIHATSTEAGRQRVAS